MFKFLSDTTFISFIEMIFVSLMLTAVKNSGLLVTGSVLFAVGAVMLMASLWFNEQGFKKFLRLDIVAAITGTCTVLIGLTLMCVGLKNFI